MMRGAEGGSSCVDVVSMHRGRGFVLMAIGHGDRPMHSLLGVVIDADSRKDGCIADSLISLHTISVDAR